METHVDSIRPPAFPDQKTKEKVVRVDANLAEADYTDEVPKTAWSWK